MNDQIPWTGGISKRQIFIETARGLVVWVAVAASLFMFFWWVTGGLHFVASHWRAPICAGIVAALSGPIARWCRA
jgi:hypothetical protein